MKIANKNSLFLMTKIVDVECHKKDDLKAALLQTNLISIYDFFRPANPAKPVRPEPNNHTAAGTLKFAIHPVSELMPLSVEQNLYNSLNILN